MNLTFRERAQRLGHSLELIDAGIPVSSTITVETPEQLKEVIRIFNPRSGPELAKLLFGDIPITDPNKDGSVEGTLRRLNEFVYSDAPLSEKDRVRIKNAFPISLQASSYPNMEPTQPVIYNNPVKPQALNAGTLTLNQGIYVTAYQTVFTMCVDDLVRNGNSGNPNIGDINIFGNTGTIGATAGSGNTGATGSQGSGSSCTVSGTEPGANGGPGGTGGQGLTGGQGGDGGNGQPSYQATITIANTITGNVLVFNRSGTGGSGTQGGQGGRGGQGGNGANGANCACTGTNGGNAGNGGDGGVGGTGGNGGNAVDKAADIAVYVAKAYINNIQGNTGTAPFGNYGTGGLGGPPGPPGSAGSAGKTASGGAGGNHGVTGSTGPNGKSGTITGKGATININPI